MAALGDASVSIEEHIDASGVGWFQARLFIITALVRCIPELTEPCLAKISKHRKTPCSQAGCSTLPSLNTPFLLNSAYLDVPFRAWELSSIR